jgi:hypothetical protein
MLTHYAWSMAIFNLYRHHSHIQTLPPVLPHLRLVQGRPHHLTKIASACLLCFASNQFLSNLWFFVRGLLQAGPTVALQKPQRCLMVHIVGLLPWWCFKAIWKSSGELKLGKWHHCCVINHKMEFTWSHPFHGSELGSLRRQLWRRLMVWAACCFWAGFHRSSTGHNTWSKHIV